MRVGEIGKKYPTGRKVAHWWFFCPIGINNNCVNHAPDERAYENNSTCDYDTECRNYISKIIKISR